MIREMEVGRERERRKRKRGEGRAGSEGNVREVDGGKGEEGNRMVRGVGGRKRRVKGKGEVGSEQGGEGAKGG